MARTPTKTTPPAAEPALNETALATLDAAPRQLAVAHEAMDEVLAAGIDLGRLEALDFVLTVSTTAILPIYENVKKSKAWRLLRNPQSADGQLAAIGYANQLASNQSNQLLQIRSLLIAQQNAVASQMQAEADLEAQYQASRERLFDMGSPTDRSKNKGF